MTSDNTFWRACGKLAKESGEDCVQVNSCGVFAWQRARSVSHFDGFPRSSLPLFRHHPNAVTPHRNRDFHSGSWLNFRETVIGNVSIECRNISDECGCPAAPGYCDPAARRQSAGRRLGGGAHDIAHQLHADVDPDPYDWASMVAHMQRTRHVLITSTLMRSCPRRRQLHKSPRVRGNGCGRERFLKCKVWPLGLRLLPSPRSLSSAFGALSAVVPSTRPTNSCSQRRPCNRGLIAKKRGAQPQHHHSIGQAIPHLQPKPSNQIPEWRRNPPWAWPQPSSIRDAARLARINERWNNIRSSATRTTGRRRTSWPFQ